MRKNQDHLVSKYTTFKADIIKVVLVFFVALKFHDTGYSFWDRLHNFFTQIYMNCFVSSEVEQTG